MTRALRLRRGGGRLAALAVALAAGLARGDVGETGGTTLLEAPAARPAALGEAYAAEGGRVESLLYNPAGVAGMEGWQLGAMYLPGFAGDDYVAAQAGRPVLGFGAAAALAYWTSGSVDQLDPTGRLSTLTGERDLLLQFGVARPLGDTGLSLGGSVKLLRVQLLESTAATAIASDYGARWRIPGTGLAAGAAIQHVGGHEALDLANDRLPTLFRAGFTARKEFSFTQSRFAAVSDLAAPKVREPVPEHAVEVLGEVVSRIGEHAVGAELGAEYVYAGTVALRGGVELLPRGGAQREQTPTVGLGLTLRSFRLDYAAELLDFTTLNRVSIELIPEPED